MAAAVARPVLRGHAARLLSTSAGGHAGRSAPPLTTVYWKGAESHSSFPWRASENRGDLGVKQVAGQEKPPPQETRTRPELEDQQVTAECRKRHIFFFNEDFVEMAAEPPRDSQSKA